METIAQGIHWAVGLIRFILHFDVHLARFIQLYGTWTYAILGGIVFCETGLVVTPILPGDSLLFAVGAFAARGSLTFGIAWLVLATATVLGDVTNYAVGYRLGPGALERNARWIRPEYVEKTQHFYQRYGGKTIVMARFVPIVRTFSPFMAGVGRMAYRRFILFSAAGGALWVSVCLTAGYLFGNLAVVKKNFSLVILAIVAVSLLPAFVEWLRGRSSGASRTVVNGAARF